MRSQRMLLFGSGRGRDDRAVRSKRRTPIPGARRHPAADWPGGWLGQHRRPRWRAVRHRSRRRQDLARRSEDRRDHDVCQRSAEVDHRPRRHDRRRLHRRHRVRAGHRCRPRRRRQRRRRHLPDRRPDSFTVVADIGAFALSQSAGIPGRHPDRSPVRAGDLPWRVPGHRRAPQPRYRVTRDGDVSEMIAFGNIVPTGLETWATRSTWPRPDLSPTIPRTARW